MPAASVTLSAASDRPWVIRAPVVTGVSTGALMAPFAFLGPEYDDALRDFYTTTASRDVFALGSILLRLMQGESLADTGPLAALIARNVDADLLSKVAEARKLDGSEAVVKMKIMDKKGQARERTLSMATKTYCV